MPLLVPALAQRHCSSLQILFSPKGVDMCLQITQQNDTISRTMTKMLDLPENSKRHIISSPCSKHGAVCEQKLFVAKYAQTRFP